MIPISTVIGLFAHVDAGKTTFAEQLLYHSGSIRRLGRVDHQDSFFDYHSIERERGITVFSKEARFQIGSREFVLVDTPGHVDFSAETESVMAVLDYAVVIVSAAEGIQSHTRTIWELLCHYGVPTLFFLNKTDRMGVDIAARIQELSSEFGVFAMQEQLSDSHVGEQLMERLAETDEALLEQYVSGQKEASFWRKALAQAVMKRDFVPCFFGSALQGEGIAEFAAALPMLTMEKSWPDGEMGGLVYKIRHDKQGIRISFLRITSGSIKAKEEIQTEEGKEKINEIRQYNGEKHQVISGAKAGELCAISGPEKTRVGWGIGADLRRIALQSAPVLTVAVFHDKKRSDHAVLEDFRRLQQEDPALKVEWKNEQIQVQIMGKIQMEVLKKTVYERFGYEISFGDYQVLYKESIRGEVHGCGHFEPLRHYAEVHLRLKEGERGSGITFDSACPLDELSRGYQNLIRQHIFEKEHIGVLIGAPVTDIHITLLGGRAHLKHTEGGDFREATYRAVRQGLMQAQGVILEPVYRFEIRVGSEWTGRVLADIQKYKGTAQTPYMIGQRTVISGSAPVSTFLNYGQELRLFTKGDGQLMLQSGGWQPCHNAQEVIEKAGYQKERDRENTGDSVFCSKGSGFVVSWDKAMDFMHCKVE